MKNIFVLLLALSIQTCAFASTHHLDRQLKEMKKNKQHNSVQKLTKEYKNTTTQQIPKTENIEIKDPELIKLKEYKKISDKNYKTKLSKDEAIYKKTIIPILSKQSNTININPEPVDFYKIYRVSEKLIRANKLDYANWRIAVRKTPEDFNASASSTNLIIIHTALYDTIYNNEDVLAFVIAHEMSHHLLGHTERIIELNRKLNKLSNLHQNTDNPYIQLADKVHKMGYITKVANESKMMEYMADAEAMNLLIRAGYSPEKALKFFDIADTISTDKRVVWSTHPTPADRTASAKENIAFANPNWINEGILNIYNSSVIPCKKSSDRVSIILEKSNTKTEFYETEELEDKLLRLAYISYKNGNMETASKYFNKLTDISDNFAYYLYDSYANEYLYKTTNENKYLKRANKAIETAQSISPDNEHVKKQINDLKNLL